MLIISALTHHDPASYLRRRGGAAIFGFLVFLTASCDQSGADTGNTETNRNYQLCPKSGDARAKLYELVKAYAAREQARVIDRGADAQDELAAMESRVLESTNLPVVLLTIEKPKALGVTITNLGLKEKFALAVRVWNDSESDSKSNAFLSQVERFWSLQEVEGGITNDPPCPAS